MEDVPDTTERWLTYAEVGKLLGISVGAARQMVRRHKWPRRTPNEYGAVARVLVPPDKIPPVPAGVRAPDVHNIELQSVLLLRPSEETSTADERGTTRGRLPDVPHTAADSVQANEREAVLRTMLD